MHLIIVIFNIIAFIRKKGTFGYGQKCMDISKNIQSNGRIMDVSSCCDFINRKSGNAIYKYMVFVAPVEFIVLFI